MCPRGGTGGGGGPLLSLVDSLVLPLDIPRGSSRLKVIVGSYIDRRLLGLLATTWFLLLTPGGPAAPGAATPDSRVKEGGSASSAKVFLADAGKPTNSQLTLSDPPSLEDFLLLLEILCLMMFCMAGGTRLSDTRSQEEGRPEEGILMSAVVGFVVQNMTGHLLQSRHFFLVKIFGVVRLCAVCFIACSISHKVHLLGISRISSSRKSNHVILVECKARPFGQHQSGDQKIPPFAFMLICIIIC